MLCVPQDGHVRVWDLRTPQCQAILPVNSHPCVAFDQQGLVFAVGADNGIIKLYDVGGYQQGPFDVFVVSGWGTAVDVWSTCRCATPDSKGGLRLLADSAVALEAGSMLEFCVPVWDWLCHTYIRLRPCAVALCGCMLLLVRRAPMNACLPLAVLLTQIAECRNSPLPFSHLSFSNDGKYLLAVVESRVYVLDAFEGGVVQKWSNGTPEAGTPPEASISHDSQFVLSGGWEMGAAGCGLWCGLSLFAVMTMQALLLYASWSGCIVHAVALVKRQPCGVPRTQAFHHNLRLSDMLP
jgi:WD40 repeat protein